MLRILFTLQDYPLEKAVGAMVALNPIELARTIVLLQMDVSALMTLTGAVIQEFLGATSGIICALRVLRLWIRVTLWSAVSIFRRKDL